MAEIQYLQITTEEKMDAVRQLFREYADSSQSDSCFQQFEEELANLPGKYAPPDGVIILAMVDDQPAGCVALRRRAEETCEMKRLYVNSSFRGLGLGKQLVEHVIREAEVRRYRYIRLATLPEMANAQRLYEAFGFYDIEPYVRNPIQGARYMELKI